MTPLPGDEALTLREVFERHAPSVWRALRHLGVREADLQDVCQEVFLVVHRRLPDFAGRSSLATWIYGICLRTASDYRRKAYHRREAIMDEPPSQVVPAGQDEALQQRQLREQLAGLLEQLDDDKRQVFVLYEIEELPMKEIAQLQDCPLQTAYSRLHAARRALAEALEGARRSEGSDDE